MSEHISLSKEELYNIVEEAFLMGLQNQLHKDGKIDFGTRPIDTKEMIKYAQKFLIDKERDEECLRCGRYNKGSCSGVLPRGRNQINSNNVCGAFYVFKQEN